MRTWHCNSSLIAVALIASACAKNAAPEVGPRAPTPATAAPTDATGSAAQQQPQPPQPAGPIVIGHYASLTGPVALFGIAADQGLRLAVEERNAKGGVKGRKIELVSMDDAGKMSEAAVAARRLIQEHKAIALIGGIASSSTLAAAPIAQAAKVPMITPAATNPDVTSAGEYTFRTCFMDDFQGWADAKFARENLKAMKAAVLYDQSQAYSAGLADHFARAFVELGGKVVTKQRYTAGDLAIDKQLAAIKKSGAQVVFLPGYYSDAGTILRKARDARVTVPFLGGDGWESEELPRIAGDVVNGHFYSAHFVSTDDSAESSRFAASYRQKYSAEADSIAALAYDSAQVLFDALERAPTTAGKDVRDAIAATKAFTGVTGTFAFDENRNAQRSALIVTYKNGKPAVAARITKP